jgi:hypothetical protein
MTPELFRKQEKQKQMF